MTTQKIINEMTAIITKNPEVEFALRNLLEELKTDEYNAQLTKTKGKSIVQRKKMLEKLIKKNDRTEWNLPFMKTINDKDFACFICGDGVSAFFFENNYLGFTNFTNSNLNVAALIPDKSEMDKYTIDKTKLKMIIEDGKAKRKANKTKESILVTVGCATIDAEKLNDCLTIIDSDIIYIKNAVSVMYFENENNFGLLCPVKKRNNIDYPDVTISHKTIQ